MSITQKISMRFLKEFLVNNLIPSCVLEILQILESQGFKSYLVGGCVRDMLMSKTPKDWDICTQAKPDQLKKLFPNPITLGEKFGTIGIESEVGIIEITTFRQDLEYQNFRHPKVAFVNELDKDLKRRDFTINAMAYHPKEGIIDLFFGTKDLEEKILRCVGDVKKRFCEDALRILRLVRFSCTFGFSPDSQTLQEAIKCKNLLQNIAQERIASELKLILQGEFLSDFFGIYLEIFALVLPELQKPKKYKTKNFALLLACLFNETSALNHLQLPKEIKLRAQTLITYKKTMIQEDPIKIKLLLKEIGYDCFMALLELKKLNGENIKKLYAMTQTIMINDECFSLKDLKIKGVDLQKSGIYGVKIGETLEELLLLVIQGEVSNTLEALQERVDYLSRK